MKRGRMVVNWKVKGGRWFAEAASRDLEDNRLRIGLDQIRHEPRLRLPMSAHPLNVHHFVDIFSNFFFSLSYCQEAFNCPISDSVK